MATYRLTGDLNVSGIHTTAIEILDSDVGGPGISLAEGSRVDRVRVVGTGDTCIEASVVTNSLAVNCAGDGTSTPSGLCELVSDNMVVGKAANGIRCSGTIRRNKVRYDINDGIHAADASVVDNVVVEAGDDGIDASASSVTGTSWS